MNYIWQIDKYEAIYEEAEAINKTTVFDKWFRVDVQLFKHALLNNIKKWSYMFKQHLVNHVTNRFVVCTRWITNYVVKVWKMAIIFFKLYFSTLNNAI